MQHENVISLPAGEALLQGQIVEIDTSGNAVPFGVTSEKEKAIGVVLQDVTPDEIGDAAAIHLFSGIFIAEAQGPINTGDVIGTKDNSPYLNNAGTLRQLGVSLESFASGIQLIRVVAS